MMIAERCPQLSVMTGIDLAPEMIARAGAVDGSTGGRSVGQSYQVADVDGVPSADQSMDLGVPGQASSPLDDPAAGLRDIVRVLRTPVRRPGSTTSDR